ncbi:MAG: 3-dehydroquinate synthase [Nostocoides sp.]
MTRPDATRRITVAGDPAYDVVVGRDLLDGVGDLVPSGAARAFIVSAGALPYAAVVGEALRGEGIAVTESEVPDAESAKTADVLIRLWGELGAAAFTRTDVVIGVGGGTVTDVAGFVAATWLRGVAWIAVPTTLLGMVDAAVGGKTGINTPKGKNLVGSFHPPVGVLCDLDVLGTLPAADYVAGLAEIVKAGFIADPVILDLVEADPAAATRADGPHTVELIERAIAVKAQVVGKDLKESGLREILNYGHTLGHAIEQAEGYRLRHGEAVAIGMVFAAELAHRAGRIDDGLLARHRTVLASVGLPTTYADSRLEDLLAAMGRDKKTRGSTLRFIVLDGLARPGRLVGPTDAELRAAYDRLGTA